MRRYLLLCLSVSFLATGCVNDDNSDNYSFPLNIGSVSLNGLVTRSSTLLASEGATVSVSALSSGAVSATSQYTYTSGAWSAASGSPGLAPLAGTALCAYYPYSASITNKAAIPLTSASNVSTNDLSYGYATSVSDAASGTSRATFVLQHAYAQLTFSFAGGTGYAGSTVIGDVSICNPGIASSGSLNITQTPAVYTKVLSGVTFNAGITSIPTTGTREASVLMVPTDALSGDLNIVIKVGSEYKLLTLPVTYFANSKLEAGTNYQISVNLNAANGNISLGSTAVKTIDWVTGTAANNAVICDAGDQPESNCYIVAPSTTIYIPVSRASTANPTNFSLSDAFTTGLLWSDISVDHITVTSVDRYIKVTAGSTPGNSVVYAKNSSGNIVWSWHIWVTGYNPKTTNVQYNNLTWMDRNLGATTNAKALLATYGLLYQWGRKDPFPGSAGITGVIAKTIYGYTVVNSIGATATEAITNDSYVRRFSIGNSPVPAANAFNYSVQYPLVFFTSWAGSSATATAGTTVTGGIYSWNGSDGTKTIYDPCPAGWRVPVNGSWENLSTSNLIWSPSDYGRTYSTPSFFYPTSGGRMNDSGSLGYIGQCGFYWSASTYYDNAYSFTFDNGKVTPSNNGSRAYGLAVRCVHE